MNSRERVKAALSFRQPDRAPISHAVLPAAMLKYGEPLRDLLCDYPEDFGWDYMPDLAPAEFPPQYRAGESRDDFGTVWRGEWLGLCGIPVSCPLANLDQYEQYKWPEVFSAGPPRGRLYSGHMTPYDGRWYARGAWITFFEQLQQLRGMENLLLDIARDGRVVRRLIDDMLAFNLAWIGKWVTQEYDGLHFADDWGAQTSLLVNPSTWRRLFKPCYAEMFRRVQAKGMDVWFHSDGKINDILGDLLEIGVNVVNCQVSVVGHEWLRRNARGRVAFRTDIDRQRVLPFGSPAEVDEEVQKTFEACGTADGGLIACGEVGPDVPFENIQAMYAAFWKYGRTGGGASGSVW